MVEAEAASSILGLVGKYDVTARSVEIRQLPYHYINNHYMIWILKTMCF